MPNSTSRIIRAFVRALVYTVLTGATLFAEFSLFGIDFQQPRAIALMALWAVVVFGVVLVWQLMSLVVRSFREAAQIIDRGVRGER